MSIDKIAQHVAIDGPIAAAALSAPWWLNQLEIYMQAALILGGLILVVIRIVVALRELNEYKSKHKS